MKEFDPKHSVALQAEKAAAQLGDVRADLDKQRQDLDSKVTKQQKGACVRSS